MRKIFERVMLSLVMLMSLTLPAFAMTANPSTGDINGQFIWIMIGLVVVSGGLIVAFFLTGKKKKK